MVMLKTIKNYSQYKIMTEINYDVMARKYGRARLKGGIYIVRKFDNALAAIQWYDRLHTGWLRWLVTGNGQGVMIYHDRACTAKIVTHFDAFRYFRDMERKGFHVAWAKYKAGLYA